MDSKLTLANDTTVANATAVARSRARVWWQHRAREVSATLALTAEGVRRKIEAVDGWGDLVAARDNAEAQVQLANDVAVLLRLACDAEGAKEGSPEFVQAVLGCPCNQQAAVR